MLQLLTPSASSRTKVHLVRRQVGRSTLLAGSVLALSTGLAFGQAITRNGAEFESVDGARDAQVSADGSLTFTDGSGRELTVRSGQYVVSNNQVFIREDIFNALFDGVAAAGGGGMGAILGVVGGLVLVGALASAGGGSGSTPTPVADTAPTISSAGAVASQTLATGVLHTVSASDEGNIASFAITGGADAATFNIDANGQITFESSVPTPTQSVAGTDVYEIIVTVTDNSGKTTSQTITLTLDDTAPTFTAASAVSMDEGGTDVERIAATDTQSSITYSFGGGVDDALFTIDPATGDLSFTNAPDFENEQDVGTDNTYDVIITATDAAGNASHHAVSVTVNDLDDTAPVFSVATAAVSIDENDSTTVIHTANATDVDTTTALIYSLDAAALGAGFSINSGTGEITHSFGLDYESTPGPLTLTVTASDGTNSSTQTVTVSVNDLDDADPTIAGEDSGSIEEGSTATAYQIVASDNEGVTGYILGGADAAKFDVSATGAVSFISGADYEAPGSDAGTNTYTITVSAIDAAGNTASPKTVTIEVTDLVTASGAVGSVTEGDYDTMVTSGTLSPGTGGFGVESATSFTSVTPETIVGQYGTLVIAANGEWTYEAAKTTILTALDVGNSEIDTFTVTTDAGPIDIKITVNGAETGGVFTGGYTANLMEGNKHDAVATATGSVVIDDLDTGDTAATVTAATGVLGLYGSLDIDVSGNWTYTLDQSKVQWLRDGEDVIDRLYVTLSDGTEQAIEITIEGVDEFTDIDDPYYASQWHLTDMEAAAAWERATGYGVAVGVFDDGVESDNTDLLDNYDSSKHQDDGGTNVDGYDAAAGQSTHGTSVAGIISATGQNNIGGVGVAFNSDVTGIVQLFGSSTEAPESEWVNFDVVNNSWGSLFGFVDDFSIGRSSDTALALEDATTNGRGGLGTVITFATGNSRTAYITDKAHAQNSDVTTSRYSIAVTGHSETGFAADYAQRGHSVLVSGQTDGIHTTDRTDDGEGYNTGGDGIYGADLSYNSTFNGTSAATPMVTGIAALILDINADLGWRDVKDILATAATYTGSAPGDLSSLEDFGWQTNGATTFNGGGFHISGDYGFGAANAKNAVALAETWLLTGQSAKTSLNEELLSLSDTTSQLLRSADADGVTFDFTVAGASDMLVEYISVTVDWAGNTFASDFQILLIAPDGTEIILADPEVSKLAVSVTAYGEIATGIPENNYEIESFTGASDWIFGVETMRGVAAEGTWGVQIIDTQNGYGAVQTSTDIDAVNLDFYGTAASNDTTYYYTDEFFLMAASDASRSDLVDAAGTDTINAAAVTGDLDVDGAPGGGEATIGLSIGSTTTIENFISGSGDDTLTGNTADNKIWGREGADTIDGAAGADTIDGGLGDDVLTGGDDADVFVFTPASGADEITDFKVGVDSIELHGYGVDASDIYDMLSFDGSGNVIFDTGTDSITLTGITSLAGIEDSFTLVA